MTDVVGIVKIENLIADLEKRRDELIREGGEEARTALIQARVAPIFAEFGDLVTNVAWVQYVPYFNDGDPCTWSIIGPGINVRTIDYSVEDEPEDWEGYAEEIDTWDFQYCMITKVDDDDDYFVRKRAKYPGFNKQSAEALLEALKPIERWLENSEGYLNDWFGHAVVVVNRDGTVSVEEYDHD